MGFLPFTARIEPGRSATTIALAGELDMATVSILEGHLVRVEADGAATIMIDLREVTFIETVGLRTFIAARKLAEAKCRQLLLLGAKPPVRRAFELTGTESLLDDQDVVSVLGS